MPPASKESFCATSTFSAAGLSPSISQTTAGGQRATETGLLVYVCFPASPGSVVNPRLAVYELVARHPQVFAAYRRRRENEASRAWFVRGCSPVFARVGVTVGVSQSATSRRRPVMLNLQPAVLEIAAACPDPFGLIPRSLGLRALALSPFGIVP